MKDFETGLTAARLRQVLNYDPATGAFLWLVTNSARKPAGSAAGEVRDSGYVMIGIDRRRYRAHRLAWLYMTGEWPADQVDHKDIDRSNNRWQNLRAATNQRNQANTHVSRNNKCGVKGVFWNKQRQKWQAKITIKGHPIHGGFFDRLEDAGAAYAAMARRYFGEFARAA